MGRMRARTLASSTSTCAAVAVACGLLAGRVAAGPLTCTSDPPGAPPFLVEIVTDPLAPTNDPCQVAVRGRLALEGRRGWDVYIVVDSSGSTAGASGVDLDGDGVVGQGDWRANTDPADSTLRAELEAVRRALRAWEGLDVRVALEEYSAVIPIPPGEPNEQGRIRTVQGLTADLSAVEAALGVIASSGSVGATDYGGALTELAAEYDRSGTPSRQPVAFYLSDGKPTFPRFPFDANEAADVDHAMAGAQLLADRRLPVHTLEVGVFDDIGVLAAVADLTGGTLLPGLAGAALLDAIAGVSLDGFTAVQWRNVTLGTTVQAPVSPDGTFELVLPLDGGENELVLTGVIQGTAGEWTITCPLEVAADCPRLSGDTPGRTGRDGGTTGGGRGGDAYETPDREFDGGGGRRGGGGGGRVGGDDAERARGGAGGANRRRWSGWISETDRRVFERWGVTECPALDGTAPIVPDCALALQQLVALLRSLEVGELRDSCRLDPSLVPSASTVEELVEDLERAIDRQRSTDCATLAAQAARVTGGQALLPPISGPAPSANPTFECTVVQDGVDFAVVVEPGGPPPGTRVGDPRSPCPAEVVLTGETSATGSQLHDVYFVVDISGSTAGDSGRDLDGDTVPENTLETELSAIGEAVSRLDPARVRVALVEFSAVIPIPPGEPNEQGRIRTVCPLTSDFARFGTALDTVLAVGSAGATDYGGALLELAAEFDRNGDPQRGQVAFFLSDGKPTFPRYPFDATEANDVAHAMAGAQACADRALRVNTYEVGVFDDNSTLEAVADLTGGAFTAALSGGAIVDALPGATLVGIERVVVRNAVTGQVEQASLTPGGAYSATIDLVPGANSIVITVTSQDGEEVVECVTELVGDCAVLPCAARLPSAWHDADCP